MSPHWSWQRPRMWNNGINLCLYHLPRVCHTLVPEICVRPEIFRVFRYIDVLMCVIYNCTQLNSKDDWSYSCGTQTHGINGFSLLRQWSCSYPATCQYACVNKKTTDELIVLLYCDVHTNKFLTLNLQCYSDCVLFVDVELYRQWLTVLRHHWRCCIFYCHNIISSGSPPVFIESTS